MRYYDPDTDQFLSVDPLVAETGQPYAFTRDDPLNLTDPLGLAPQPKTLSKQEQELLNESSNGRNFKDGKALTPAQRRAWNQANQKQIYNEKVAEQAVTSKSVRATPRTFRLLIHRASGITLAPAHLE